MIGVIFSQRYLRGSDDVPIIIGVLILFLVITIISVIYNKKMREKRRKEMEELSGKIGFSFTDHPFEDFPSSFSNFNLFKIGYAKKTENVLEGTFDDIRLQIFDYQYTVSSGKSSHTHYHTVFCAYVDDFSLPGFELRREGFFDKMGDMLGFKDIDFDSHPDFSNRYLLKGSDEEEIRRLFSPKVLEYFEKRSEDISVEADGNKIVVYSTATTGWGNETPTEQIPAFYKEVTLIVRILRDAALTF